MKTINLSKLLLSFLLLSIISCKKDSPLKEDVFLHEARSWYDKKYDKAEVSLIGSKKILLASTVNWVDAQCATSGNKSVIAIPLSVSTKQDFKLNGQFILLISKIDGEFTSIVTYEKEKIRNGQNLLKGDLITIFNNSLALNKAHEKKLMNGAPTFGSREKVMLMNQEQGGGEGCIDWYWTVYAIDYDGNPLYIISESYMFTTCQNQLQDNGTPTEVEDEPQQLWGTPESEHSYFNLVQETTNETPVDTPPGEAPPIDAPGNGTAAFSSRTVEVGWWFHTNPARNVRFRSIERAVVAKNIFKNYWHFSDFQHISTITVGNTAGESRVNMLSVSHINVDIYAKQHGIKLSYQETYTFTFRGKRQTDSSTNLTSDKTWTAEQVANEY